VLERVVEQDDLIGVLFREQIHSAQLHAFGRPRVPGQIGVDAGALQAGNLQNAEQVAGAAADVQHPIA